MSKGENITHLLSKSSCYCLNEDPRSGHAHLFYGDNTLALKSDADEQLILHLAFGQTCALKSIFLGVPDDESCPDTVKFFLNQTNIGFGDANSDMKPIQSAQLIPGKDITIDLLPAKWNRTDSITIFVQNNHGSPISSLHSIRIYGIAVMSTNVADIKSGSG